MADENEHDDALEVQIERLEKRLGGAGALVAKFDAELARMTASMGQARVSVGRLSGLISRGLRKAFDGLVLDGGRASDALRSVGTTIVDSTYSAALRPVTKHIGGLIGQGLAHIGAVGFATGGVFTGGRSHPGGGGRVSAFAKGGAFGSAGPIPAGAGSFTAEQVRPFAAGGVVTGPTVFPLRTGTGLMGEAGPEAILPLARGADGRLGVQAGGSARPVQVTVNVSTPDVEGFRRSGGQIAAQMGRALARGQRNR
jgi:hypothetical protein